MGTYEEFSKYLLIAVNILFMEVAIIYIGVGIWLKSFEYEREDIAYLLNIVAVVVLTVGVLLIPLAFLGCWGAFKENVCMLNTYAWILVVLLVCGVILIIIDCPSSQFEEPVSDDVPDWYNKFILVRYISLPIEVVCIGMAFYFSHCIRRKTQDGMRV